MLNSLLRTMRRHDMISPGDAVVCAVSGGADSMALLWAMYLMRDKLQISVSAAHFNHHLRGEESERDAAFVRSFCRDYDIPFFEGQCRVVAGSKGLEAAAREARYGFFETLPGKIATAHTADDNAETVLMHLVRGTGLKGLGAIAPVNGRIIRPMLDVTRNQVLAFLQAYHILYVEDSSNAGDGFLRNRIRHHVMPLLKQENPKFSQNLSATAQRLREDEAALEALTEQTLTGEILTLRGMEQAQRNRVLAKLLKLWGVPEPESEHIALVERLVFSENPSAKVSLPGGVVVERGYERLKKREASGEFSPTAVLCPGVTKVPELGLQIVCTPACAPACEKNCFTVMPQGQLWLRSRKAGDTIRLPGGTKQLKKLFIDRKIPASQRLRIPVLADSHGVLGVYGFGPNRERLTTEGMEIRFEVYHVKEDKGRTTYGE